MLVEVHSSVVVVEVRSLMVEEHSFVVGDHSWVLRIRRWEALFGNYCSHKSIPNPAVGPAAGAAGVVAGVAAATADAAFRGHTFFAIDVAVDDERTRAQFVVPNIDRIA